MKAGFEIKRVENHWNRFRIVKNQAKTPWTGQNMIWSTSLIKPAYSDLLGWSVDYVASCGHVSQRARGMLVKHVAHVIERVDARK